MVVGPGAEPDEGGVFDALLRLKPSWSAASDHDDHQEGETKKGRGKRPLVRELPEAKLVTVGMTDAAKDLDWRKSPRPRSRPSARPETGGDLDHRARRRARAQAGADPGRLALGRVGPHRPGTGVGRGRSTGGATTSPCCPGTWS